MKKRTKEKKYKWKTYSRGTWVLIHIYGIVLIADIYRTQNYVLKIPSNSMTLSCVYGQNIRAIVVVAVTIIIVVILHG